MIATQRSTATSFILGQWQDWQPNFGSTCHLGKGGVTFRNVPKKCTFVLAQEDCYQLGEC